MKKLFTRLKSQLTMRCLGGEITLGKNGSVTNYKKIYIDCYKNRYTAKSRLFFKRELDQ